MSEKYYKTDTSKAKKAVEKSGRSGQGPEVCVKRMHGDPCKYCKKVEMLYASKAEEDKAIATRCRARATFYMNVLDLDNKDAGVQIYGSGIENWRTLVGLLPDSEHDEDRVDFTDPESASAILLKRSGKGLDTSYVISVSNKKFELPAAYLKKMHNLSNILDIVADESAQMFVPEDGKTHRLYIFPPWGKDADGDFWKEVFYHWNTNLLALDDEGGDAGFESGKSEKGGKSEFKDEAFSAGDDEEKDELKEKLDKMSKRELINFITAEDIDITVERKMPEEEIIDLIIEAKFPEKKKAGKKKSTKDEDFF